MKRIVINILTGAFALAMLIVFALCRDTVSISEKKFFLLLLAGVLVVRILGELVYLYYLKRLLNTSAADAVPLWGGLKIIKNSEFACPNCGGHFKKTWWHYVYFFLRHRAVALFTFGKTNFRCPHCKKFDTCVVVHKD